MDLQNTYHLIAIILMVLWIILIIAGLVVVILVGRSLNQLANTLKAKSSQVETYFINKILKRASIMSIIAPLVSIVLKQMLTKKRK